MLSPIIIRFDNPKNNATLMALHKPHSSAACWSDEKTVGIEYLMNLVQAGVWMIMPHKPSVKDESTKIEGLSRSLKMPGGSLSMKAKSVERGSTARARVIKMLYKINGLVLSIVWPGYRVDKNGLDKG